MDREAFRERFKAYKEGKPVSEIYDAGLPKYGKGKQGFSAATKKQIDKLYKVLQSKGFDAISAAGIIGNAIQESSLNPDSVNQLGYSGLFLNSKQIRKAIEEQYGDYSYDSQLRYLDDWTSGNTWIRKGKHRDYTAAGSGAFKRTGYKTAHDAADAFMKLYERPVIMKDGKVIGYQDWDKRRAYAQLVHDYLTGVETSVPMTETTAAEYNAEHQFLPWSNYHQPDYSLSNSAPASISSWNNPKSPAYTPAGLQARRIDFGKMMMDMLEDDWEPPVIQPLLTVNAPDAKVSTFTGFKDGKLPRYKDGTRYLWDDQTQSWDRITDSDVANAMAEWAFTPTTTRAKFDYENTPNPVKPIQKNAVISQDNNAWTKQRVAEESNKRTWLSDAADVSHAIGEGAMFASNFATPEIEPLVYPMYNAFKTAASSVFRQMFSPRPKLEHINFSAIAQAAAKMKADDDAWRVANPKYEIENILKKLKLPNAYDPAIEDLVKNANLEDRSLRSVFDKMLYENKDFHGKQIVNLHNNRAKLSGDFVDDVGQVFDVDTPEGYENAILFLEKHFFGTRDGAERLLKDPDFQSRLAGFSMPRGNKPVFISRNKLILRLERDLGRKLTLQEADDLYYKVISHERHHSFDKIHNTPEGFNLDGLSPDDYFVKNGFDELAARGTLLKNMFGLYKNPLTAAHLRYASSQYFKDPSNINNNMTRFFNMITDYDKAAKWLQENATAVLPYTIGGSIVASLPEYKNGKSPIHIKPANRGKFNATKKRTGKTTEELAHSKNPLTRKRAIFALNARKWKH